MEFYKFLQMVNNNPNSIFIFTHGDKEQVEQLMQVLETYTNVRWQSHALPTEPSLGRYACVEIYQHSEGEPLMCFYTDLPSRPQTSFEATDLMEQSHLYREV